MKKLGEFRPILPTDSTGTIGYVRDGLTSDTRGASDFGFGNASHLNEVDQRFTRGDFRCREVLLFVSRGKYSKQFKQIIFRSAELSPLHNLVDLTQNAFVLRLGTNRPWTKLHQQIVVRSG